MRLAHRLTSAASAVGVALAVACCGKTSPAGALGDGGSESPCDDYFTAVYGCLLGSTFPASEKARIRSRYDQSCASMLSLPGMNITASFLGQCTMATETYGCGMAEQNDCEAGGLFLAAPFYVAAGGALGAGAACVLPQQCQTYRCSAGSSTADGGTPACGTCSSVAGPCNVTGACAPGTLCARSVGDAGMTYTCETIAYGGSGAACDAYLNECNPGLSCNAGTGTCAPPGPSGTVCGADGDCRTGLVCSSAKDAATDASVTGAVIGTCAPPGPAGAPCGADQDCKTPLVCPHGPSTCHSPGQAGAPCGQDYHCAAGLGCADGVCTSVTWVSAGQPCNDTTRCLVGNCGGTCPAVIPDGQPCSNADSTSICDTFAQCFEGTCHLTYEGVCP